MHHHTTGYPTPGTVVVFLALLFCLLSSSCQSPSSPPTDDPPPTGITNPAPTPPVVETTAVSVVPPEGSPPDIDGSLQPGEWDGASRFQMSDGAAVHLMHSNKTLYLAVQGEAVGAVNVVIGTEAEVWILHSSAALGSARYVPVAGSWELAHGFAWCCRSVSDQSGRSALFDKEGWQANIGFAGEPGVVEYEVAFPWQKAVLAVSSIRDADDQGFWPAELSSEARGQLVGSPPPERHFNSDEWVRLSQPDE